MHVLLQLSSLIKRNKPSNLHIYCACVGIACITYKNKDIIGKYLQVLYRFLKPNVTKVINNEIEGKYTVELLTRKCHEIRVLGLDCEWISNEGGRKPVALLQLATSDGFCSLFRLCCFKTIPTELLELLNNDSILKVGVAVHNDAKYLMKDYGLKCEGFLDLRYLARQLGETPQGLAGLAKDQLGVELDKNWRIRCSDWEAECLTHQQITYAAQDALVAVQIFHKLNKKQLYKTYGVFKCAFWNKETYWENSKNAWKQYINLNFRERGYTTKLGTKSRAQIPLPKKVYHTLTKPHYANIYLQAPDGQVLCTISESKSEWYLQKALADVISDNPRIIKLRFQPGARETEPNGYYTRAKKNICVVCGSEHSFRRKNIVPLEYRKHFPVKMKEHSSHDVLLLCCNCHTQSNFQDQILRERLGLMCHAPIKDKINVKVKEVPELKNVRSAARALYLSSDVIPEMRQNELKKIICDFLNIDSKKISKEILEELKDINPCIEKEDYISHGQKVVEFFATNPDQSLEQFERLWRQHFVDSMSPLYLPELWSINHKRS